MGSGEEGWMGAWGWHTHTIVSHSSWEAVTQHRNSAQSSNGLQGWRLEAVGRGSRERGPVYTGGWFTLLCSRNGHSIVNNYAPNLRRLSSAALCGPRRSGLWGTGQALCLCRWAPLALVSGWRGDAACPGGLRFLSPSPTAITPQSPGTLTPLSPRLLLVAPNENPAQRSYGEAAEDHSHPGQDRGVRPASPSTVPPRVSARRNPRGDVWRGEKNTLEGRDVGVTVSPWAETSEGTRLERGSSQGDNPSPPKPPGEKVTLVLSSACKTPGNSFAFFFSFPKHYSFPGPGYITNQNPWM